MQNSSSLSLGKVRAGLSGAEVQLEPGCFTLGLKLQPPSAEFARAVWPRRISVQPSAANPKARGNRLSSGSGKRVIFSEKSVYWFPKERQICLGAKVGLYRQAMYAIQGCWQMYHLFGAGANADANRV